MYRKRIILSSNRDMGVTILSADRDGNCLGGTHHISVKFGVSARSGCFIKSVHLLILYITLYVLKILNHSFYFIFLLN